MAKKLYAVNDDPILVSEDNVYDAVNDMVAEFHNNLSNIPVNTRGQLSFERPNALICLSDPIKRWGYISSTHAEPNVQRLIGRTIWELSGRSDIASIQPYDQMAPRFGKDGQITTPYGQRILSQLKDIIDHLKREPESRRAVVNILYPDDPYDTKAEFSCVTAIQFYMRYDQLHCTTTMRSQSVVKLLAQDLFIFTVFHELVAAALGLPLGTYCHFMVSAHVFDKDILEDDDEPSNWSQIREPLFPNPSTYDELMAGISVINLTECAIRLEYEEASHLIKEVEKMKGWETWAIYLKILYSIKNRVEPYALPIHHYNYVHEGLVREARGHE